MARKNLNDRRAAARRELEEAQAKFAKLQNEAAARIGKLAVRTGLTDLDLSDDEIKSTFEGIVARKEQENIL
ncbi:TraC family protein [Sphingobium aromaticiconvertens]|uniref:TraC family protein n=1 Tax=Sphingobium aromaticiconvertens TaxID=365341 RepID=UPI00301B4F66